jgi:hypothetical protein
MMPLRKLLGSEIDDRSQHLQFDGHFRGYFLPDWLLDGHC